MSFHEASMENIPAYVAGRLTADKASRIEEHLRICPECREFHDACEAVALELDPSVASSTEAHPVSGSLRDAAVGDATLSPADTAHVEDCRSCRLEMTAWQRWNPQAVASRRRSLLAALWRRSAKPLYNLLTRRLFDLRDGEARRSSQGPWPDWTPPVGPSEGARD